MAWTLNTYENRYAAGDLASDDALPLKVIGSVLRVQCPGCNGWRLPGVMIDARTWPVEFTGGVKWFCDGCWTRFEREGCATGEPLNDRPFTEAAMYEWSGAPAAVVKSAEDRLARFRARFDASLAERSRLRGRLHASRRGLDIVQPSPAAELATRMSRRKGQGA